MKVFGDLSETLQAVNKVMKNKSITRRERMLLKVTSQQFAIIADMARLSDEK